MLRYLLDTHALIWWWNDDSRLSESARAIIADQANEIWVSTISAMEIATKARIGKLQDLPQAVERYPLLMARNGFHSLHVSETHALKAGQYPQPHRDPYDRFLAAQSEIEGMPLLTRDPQIASFGSDIIW